MKLSKFEDSFHARLRDPDYAAGYVTMALQEGGIGEFLIALKEVASVQGGGIKHVAEASSLGRESMYKSLSKNGNPRIKTVDSLLDTLGLEITIKRRAYSSRDKAKAI